MDELAALVSELTCGDDSRSEAAVHKLAAYGLTALPALMELFSTESANTRWWATWALSEIQDPRVYPLLIRALHDPELEIRQAGALALRQQPNAGAIPDLIAALGENDPMLAILAGAALTAIGQEAVPELLKVMENGTQPARQVAARALAMIGDPRAVPSLFAALEEDSAIIEHWANEGLDRMGIGMKFLKPD
jgi:HEAT repeat protein